MKTCAVCGWIWDPHPWTKCPRCVARTRAYEPTPAQIARVCLRIQAGWTPAEKRKRTAIKPVPVETEVVGIVSDGMVRRDGEARAR